MLTLKAQADDSGGFKSKTLLQLRVEKRRQLPI
jgi:hypothetical protein